MDADKYCTRRCLLSHNGVAYAKTLPLGRYIAIEDKNDNGITERTSQLVALLEIQNQSLHPDLLTKRSAVCASATILKKPDASKTSTTLQKRYPDLNKSASALPYWRTETSRATRDSGYSPVRAETQKGARFMSSPSVAQKIQRHDTI